MKGERSKVKGERARGQRAEDGRRMAAGRLGMGEDLGGVEADCA